MSDKELENFSKIIKIFNNKKVDYVETMYTYKKIMFLYKTDTTKSTSEASNSGPIRRGDLDVGYLIKNRYKCRECTERIKTFISLQDKNGVSIFSSFGSYLEEASSKICDRSEVEEDIVFYNNINNLCKEEKREITGVYIPHTENTICNFEKTKGGFEHFTKDILNKDQRITKDDIDKINYVINRYLFSSKNGGHMFNMISKICSPTVKDGLDSLSLMKECLKLSNYGNIMSSSTDWLYNLILSISNTGKEWIQLPQVEKYNLCIGSLLKLDISKDWSGYVILTYQTASNNIVDLLGKASSIGSMIIMIEERMDPLKYQRRDMNKQLSETQINNSIKSLGEFENTIMTIQELSSYEPKTIVFNTTPVHKKDGCYTVIEPPVNLEEVRPLNGVDKGPSSIEVFQNMKRNKAPAGEFYKRTVVGADGSAACDPCTYVTPRTEGGDLDASFGGKYATSTSIMNLKTIKDLLNLTREYPNTEVQICTFNTNCVYIAKTNIDTSKLSVPYLWAFKASKVYEVNVYKKVVAIVPMFENKLLNRKYLSVHFILDKEKPFSHVNCCFPEFLSSEYTRQCGPAFEQINKYTKITIPDTEENLACGVGISSMKSNKISPIYLKINNIKVQLDLLE
ncbi:hypothetical protein Indivirus_14_6 [Indivirus ILV1]|uniref:Uncharacterized protein n=1 Tax=Indivirus ILV1 TaxID=1977633 RepID=A0A1V0SEF2_9VIRU|nr:hypothetical protein Indivirus_14_6 [Indivirus ILV1]